MIDALLYAVRDGIRNAGMGYNEAQCELTDTEGMPPPRCGTVFVAVHQLPTRTSGQTDNKLEEFYGFGVTLTQRIKAPLDRVGDQEIARKLSGPTGFNRRCEQLRSFLHMAWGLLQDANNNLMAWAPDNQGTVYGFCEPARYRGMELPSLVGDAWFKSSPPREGGNREFGLMSMLSFDGARRFQPIAEYV